jgi:hypothetical protein
VVLEGTNLPPYLFVLVCVIIREVRLCKDVYFGCIVMFDWVGPIILGVEMYFKSRMFQCRSTYICAKWYNLGAHFDI